MTALTKQSLRTHLKQMRKLFVSERNSASFPLENLSELTRDPFVGRIVAGYLAFGSEADIHDVMASLAARSICLALPWLAAADSPMLFRAWQPGAPTEKAPGGFHQPLADQPELVPDVILLPLVGFDRCGNRLGQGAGHYDRALARLDDAIRIGVAWSVQETPHVPSDPWDVPLDAIMTETEWIVPHGSRLERI